MTIAIEGRTSNKATGKKPYAARHSAVVPKRDPIERVLRELTIVLRAAMALGAGGLVLVIAGLVVEAPAFISGGSWATIAGGFAGFIVVRIERVVLGFVEGTGDATAGELGTDHQETVHVAGSQDADAEPATDGREGGSGTGLRRGEGDAWDGGDTGGVRAGVSLSLCDEVEPRRHGVDAGATDPSPVRLRSKNGGKPRERFVVLRNQVAARKPGPQRVGATGLTVLSRVGIQELKLVGRLR